MSQQPTRTCQNCRAQIPPGLTYCPNCGATQPSTPSTGGNYNPTVAATPGPLPEGNYNPTVAATPYNQPVSGSNPNINNNPYGQQANSSYNPNVTSDPYGQQANSNYNPAQGTPPPPYTQYQSQQTPPPPYTPASNDPYNAQTPGGYSYPYPQSSNNKKSLWIILGIVVAVVVLGGGGLIAAISSLNHGGGNGPGGGGTTTSYSKVITPSNLTFIYASDKITITKIEQASKFTDDQDTTYSTHGNFVRVSFQETESAKFAIVDYLTSFNLVLPDKTSAKATNVKDFSSPNNGNTQDNWIDFATDSTLDLTQLSLRVGDGSEAQMNIPFKSGADLSQYNDKSVQPNKNFTFGPTNWTILSATQSLSFDGKQAKSGEIYLTINVKVNDTGNYSLYSFNGDFIHLQGSNGLIGPETGSNASDLDTIDPGSTHQGAVTYLTPPTTNGTYTLLFKGTKDGVFNDKTVSFQFA